MAQISPLTKAGAALPAHPQGLCRKATVSPGLSQSPDRRGTLPAAGWQSSPGIRGTPSLRAALTSREIPITYATGHPGTRTAEMLRTEPTLRASAPKATAPLREDRKAGPGFSTRGSLDWMLQQNLIKEEKICPWLQYIKSSKILCQECFKKNILFVSRGTDYPSQRLLRWYFLQSKEFYYYPGKWSFFTAHAKPQISRKHKTKTYKQENNGLKFWTCIKKQVDNRSLYTCSCQTVNQNPTMRAQKDKSLCMQNNWPGVLPRVNVKKRQENFTRRHK